MGVRLPVEYKQLLQHFGPVHLPGKAKIIIKSPEEAIKATRAAWSYEGTPLFVLAISSFNERSDGNSIGFIRSGDRFQAEIYEFDHELYRPGDNPGLWTRKVGESLADFLLEYLNQ